MSRLREILDEWKARRAGRKFLDHGIRKKARGIIGPTGDLLSPAWEHLDQSGDKYLESFDRRIPPSEFVSKRDRTRQNIPIPLVERRLGEEDDVPVSHYLILGVEPTATQEEIEIALRSVPLDGEGKRPQAIEEAYAVLSDPRRRAEYDRTLL